MTTTEPTQIELSTLDFLLLDAEKRRVDMVTVDARVLRAIYDRFMGTELLPAKLSRQMDDFQKKMKDARLSALDREEENELDGVRREYDAMRAKLGR